MQEKSFKKISGISDHFVIHAYVHYHAIIASSIDYEKFKLLDFFLLLLPCKLQKITHIHIL